MGTRMEVAVIPTVDRGIVDSTEPGARTAAALPPVPADAPVVIAAAARRAARRAVRTTEPRA
jgi:hypothetical protein